ncbi:MAG: NADAR family protein [Planctomycetota bacterium]
MSSDTIRFYSTGDEYGEFSNFAPYPITLEGKRWPTTEHFFQAQKFDDSAYRERIRRANSPAIAARLGRSRKVRIRRSWESTKIAVMRRAVDAKFRQHESLRELLLSTGTATLVEHTVHDSFWGDGGNGRGRNQLGRILMEVRDSLGPNERTKPKLRRSSTNRGREPKHRA